MKPLAILFALLHLALAIGIFAAAAADPEKKAWPFALALADFPCSIILGFLCSRLGSLQHLTESSLLFQAVYFSVFGSAWFYLIGYVLHLAPRGYLVKLLSSKIHRF